MDSNLFLGSVFMAGILSFFNPCILPLIPVYFGMLSGGNSFVPEVTDRQAASKAVWRNVLLTLFFLLGLSFTFIVLGFGAGSLSILLSYPVFRIAGGILMILFGLVQLGVFSTGNLFSGGTLALSEKSTNLYIRALLLGLTISLGWIPCIGPVLASVLIIAAQAGTALKGAFFMFVYTLGMAIPFLIIALFSACLMQRIRALNRFTMLFKKIGGALLVIMGILLILGKAAF
jgi:cytochrome c-type biogenesis protein